MSEHPFSLTASQLQEILAPEDDQRPIVPPGDAPPEVIATAGGTFLVENERGQIPPPRQELTPEEIAEELGTTERLGEEGGEEPDELPDVTTLALGEEGGELPPGFPEPTGILAEQGGFISDPLPLAGDEGDELPATIEIENPDLIGEELEPGELPEPVTLRLGEDGEVVISPFPDPTDIVAEEGGVVPDIMPIFTTEAVGEEGGDVTEVLSEQGEDPGMATTLAIGEEGGVITLAEGEDGDTVFTLAEGENGEIFELGEPIEEITPIRDVDDFEIAEVADMPATLGTQDDDILEVVTAAIGEPGGFDADVYGELYPELIDAVNSGVIPSLLDHYEAFGQFESERIGIFDGNVSYDRVTAFGNNTVISGVSIVGYDAIADDFIFGGNGSGEFDVLVGVSSPNSTELFILGSSQVQPFYVGSGDADFAVIENFDVGSDRIQLSGSLEDYNFEFANNFMINNINNEIINNSTSIFTADGDLIAVVKNVPNIQDATLLFEG